MTLQVDGTAVLSRPLSQRTREDTDGRQDMAAEMRGYKMASHNISEGTPVYTQDGEMLGTVKEVKGNSFKVNAPMAADYWLSLNTLGSSSGGNATVTFGRDQLGEYRLSNFEHDVTGDLPDTDEGRTRAGREVDERSGGRRLTETDATVAGTTGVTDQTHGHHGGHETTGHQTTERTRTTASDDDTLQLREERLRVEKEQEEVGEVRLGKRVVEHEETVNVPVREERVIIERTAGSGRAVEGGITDTGSETVEVDVMRERVNVDKETVVAEEVNVRKETVERQEQVSETVRREELEVQDSGGLVTESGTARMSGGSREAGTRDQDRTTGDNPLERAADRLGDAGQEGADRLRGR